MQIVIEIPKDEYECIKENGFNGYSYQRNLIVEAISSGIPLPAGHGRLIDADALEIPSEEMISRMVIHHAPTIIEADEGDTDADSN